MTDPGAGTGHTPRPARERVAVGSARRWSVTILRPAIPPQIVRSVRPPVGKPLGDALVGMECRQLLAVGLL